MRVVVQRVARAAVAVANQEVAAIGRGLLILLGVGLHDTQADIDYLVGKITRLRIFDDDDGVMNRSVADVSGELLVVSQFTLMAQTAKGNRPSYIKAARPEVSEPLYEAFCLHIEEALGRPVARGVFGADMKVSLTNDGPVTILVDSQNREI